MADGGQSKTWIFWALLAMLSYASNNFLVDAIAETAVNPGDATVSAAFVIWVASGLCGVVALIYEGGVDVSIQDAKFSVGAAFFSAIGTLVLSVALAKDPKDAGPITAVLPLNAFLVCILAFVLIGERYRLTHLLGVCIASAGPMCMAAGSSSNALLGLALGGGAAASFGVSNFLLKKAATVGMSMPSVVITLVCAMGLFGMSSITCLALSGRGLKGLVDDPKAGLLVFYAFLSGVLWSVAKVFFQQALAGGLAGPASAIVNTNSLGVLVWQLIFFHPALTSLKLIGMLLCITGTIILSVAKSVPPAVAPTTDNLLADRATSGFSLQATGTSS